jgi:MFS family permease
MYTMTDRPAVLQFQRSPNRKSERSRLNLFPKVRKPVSTAFGLLAVLGWIVPATNCFTAPIALSTARLRGVPPNNPQVVPLGFPVQAWIPLSAKLDADDTQPEPSLFGFPRDSVGNPLVLLLLSQFILFIGVGAVIPSIPLYGKEIGLSSATNGIVISAPAVALLLGAKWGGNFADRARKPAMLMGMAAIAVADIGTALATNIVGLLVARLGLGAGRCVSEAGERGMLADLAGLAPNLRGRALAAQQATIALGIAIGAPVGGIVVETYGVRASFLCVSFAAVLTLILYIFLPETIGATSRATSKSRQLEVETPIDAPGKTLDSAKFYISEGDWGKLLSKNQWRGLALCQCGASFGFACKIASIPLLAVNVLPGGAVGAGALLSAAGLSGLLGAPVGGWLTDRTSAKSTAILSGTFSAISLMLVPAALSLSATSSMGSFLIPIGVPQIGLQSAAFSAVVLGWSVGASAQGPALTAYAQEMAPAGAEATALALPRAAGDGTYIFAPFILGIVADTILGMPGIECAAAGLATLFGVFALGVLCKDDSP